MTILSDLNKHIGYDEDYIAPQVKRSFYRISQVPTGKKGKLRWIFNPSKFVRPFQIISLKLLYLFNETLDPALAGCIPESSLPDKVKDMYGATSIYVSDIRSFFKTVNRSVLYKAMDRMLYKYLSAHTSEYVRFISVSKHAGNIGQPLTEEEREKLLHVKNETLAYTSNVAVLEHTTNLLKTRLKDLTTDMNFLYEYLWPSAKKLVLGNQQLREASYSAKDLPSLYRNTADELDYIVNNLLFLILNNLYAGEQISSSAWHVFQRECPDDCLKVSPTDILSFFDKSLIDGKRKDRHVVLNDADNPDGYTKFYQLVNKPVEHRIEFIRRILFGIVDAGTTHLNTLPEGAATSPMLANIVLDSIADEIKNKLRHKPENMILYMDDISMSYSKPINNMMAKEIGEDLDKVLNSFGLKRHFKKTKIYNKKDTRRILGINITDYKGPHTDISIRVPRYYRRGMRAVMHNFEKFINAYSTHLDNSTSLTPTDEFVKNNYPKGYTAKSHFSIKSRMREINGKLSWMKCVSKAQAKPFAERLAAVKKNNFGKIQDEVKARSIGLIELKLIPRS